jgi:transcriptional regulator of nitric oxide reductase
VYSDWLMNTLKYLEVVTPEIQMNWVKLWKPSVMAVVIAKNCLRFLNKVSFIEWNKVSSSNSFSNMCNFLPGKRLAT